MAAYNNKINKEKILKIYLYIFGFLNIFLLSFTVPIFFGFLLWEPRNIPNEMMISGIYLSMGIIMVLVAKHPIKHKGFIDFIILANVIHAGIMAIMSENIWHIMVDAATTGLMAIIPLIIYPWGLKQFLRYS